ncbi:hypothetical protein C7B65_24600 [Phormidesmis priestleyi ULC007]|uniref:Uncharacterized protein n=1 Tax=Phormidesmis priestleyi ULC007 TaxID=1920490 RepID=A0A2T1D4A4_9CYAN|nr:hypothetical protein C7B65_24600 [Phormidesmis priestleyi ULC007]PZO51597.1 MAG: hypothetical protein DCF14_08850 [Phormidesmis priestleyi]
MWGTASRQVQDTNNSDVKALMKSSEKRESRSGMTRVVSVWWWVLPIAGIPRWVGAIVAVLMVSLGIWFIRLGTFSY